jgi:hypothetical protein
LVLQEGRDRAQHGGGSVPLLGTIDPGVGRRYILTIDPRQLTAPATIAATDYRTRYLPRPTAWMLAGIAASF